MDLFSHLLDKNKNYLPEGGVVQFYGNVLSPDQANSYFNILLKDTNWQNDTFSIAGKNIITKRKIAWYGDKEFHFTYFNSYKKGEIWTEELLQLKNIIETETQERYNSCLLNLYHTGEEGLGWHSDDEVGAIASLSLGATRKFALKHNETKKKIEFNLSHGDLLVMKEETQLNWRHAVLPSKKVLRPRINITFRTISLDR